MSIIDDFLLGRNRNRQAVRNTMLQDYMKAKVIDVTDKGLVFEQTRVNGSTLGAATALQATTGMLPDGFFNGVSDNAVNSRGGSVLAFPEAQRADLFKKLTDLGIGAGSTVNELEAVLGQSGNEEIASMLQKMLSNRGGNSQALGGQPFGSRSNSSNRVGENAANFGDTVKNFLDSFKGDNGRVKGNGHQAPLGQTLNLDPRFASETGRDVFGNSIR